MIKNTTVDLQLFRVLCAVLEARSVSRAAESLHISQPAVSYSLARLRSLIDDPLFVRTPDGMSPTPRAVQIYRDVRRGIDLLASALDPTGFEPRQSDRVFRLTMSDIGEMMFLSPILHYLQQHAPRVNIDVLQVSLNDMPRALNLGEIDFAIGNLPEICSQTSYTTLFREHYVCMFRVNHGMIGDKLTRKIFEEISHVFSGSSYTGHYMIESALLERGIRRKPGLRVPHFASIANVVAETDLVAIVPQRVAEHFGRAYKLRHLPLPVRIPHFEVRIHWSEQHETNEGHRWMREIITSLLSRH
ncbi:MAG: LysR family transcriptional regulator [Xanthobacteraceae bacterium]|nr:MAG: LysR family transcriptional regulator [Xanthobacteraceae bacterium]